MFMQIMFIAVGLAVFQSSPLLACSNYDMPTDAAVGQADSKRVVADHIYASAGSMKASVACTEPRPEACSQDYRPVCAVLQDGSLNTYSNGCSACSDPAVTGYRDGACE